MNSWVERARSVGQSAPVAIALLLLANLLPLAGVLFLGWDVGMVLITYWLENGIVGLINIPKILLAKQSPTAVANFPAGRAVYAGFFLVHYGVFWLVHGVFVFFLVNLSRGGFFGSFSGGFFPDNPVRTVLSDQALAFAALALLVSHGASFLFNYIGRGEYLRTSPDAQMLAPYSRLVILHVTIVLGSFFVIGLGQPEFLVALLVIMKTGFDLFLHLRERGRASGRGAGGQGTNGPNGIDTTRAGYL